MGRRRWYNCGWWPCYNNGVFARHEDFVLQPLPKPKEADEVDGILNVEETEVLIVRKIDPCISINGALHHTSKYELMSREFEPSLIVRRGQAFRIDIYLSRPYNKDTDGISFIFAVEDEEKPSYGQGTFIAIPLQEKHLRSLKWNAVVEQTFENRITVLITTSPECVVAKWKLDVDTKMINNGAYSYSWQKGFYILYNPWCKDDQVYMRSEKWKQETVLEDVGLIWRGTSNRLRPCIWKYSQFEKDVLDCSLFLIRFVGKVRGDKLSDPVVTARAIVAAVNSVDDEGAVTGNWGTKFDDGTAPTDWVGSMEILQKYYKKKRSVKYGQCWVFAGVVTTICRTIGIPSRPVTNYSSAHDTHGSLTVDFFMDDEGRIMEELNSDSIWNFHVWNEAWMERPDLGRAYGGWQAIDATPQELSENMYRCGPASVFAVKEGEIKRPYDASFLFAEVNADKVFWRHYGPNKPLKLLRKDISGIGKMIITKATAKFEGEDITNTYKHPEKTHEERAIMLKALRQSEDKYARYYLNAELKDIDFHFILNDNIKIGETFKVILALQNRSKVDDYKMNVVLRVDVVTYNGKVGELVKVENYKVDIEKGSKTELQLLVTYDDYNKKLLDQDSFNVSYLATVDETDIDYYDKVTFRVRKPDVQIILSDSPVEKKECSASAYLVNPLPVPLRKGEFKLEGPDFAKTIKVKGNVPPGEKALVQFTFIPSKYGKHTIAAKFTSRELDDCDGYLNFWVNINNEKNEVEKTD